MRVVGVALLGALSVGCGGEGAARLYDVTIENLTAGQPLSPALVVLHGGQTGLFQIGGTASGGVQALAEQGDPARAQRELLGVPGVEAAVVSDGVIAPSVAEPARRMVRVAAVDGADRISVAAMLICTNDGFAGVDGALLPVGFEPLVVSLTAYDAGTEANDERTASLDDVCQAIGPVAGPRDGNGGRPTADPVAPHGGIGGVGDLDPAAYGWGEFVVRITVQKRGIWR